MRLAIDFGGAMHKLGQEYALGMVKEAGFDGVDYGVKSFLLEDDYLEVAQKTRALLDQFGLACVQAHAPHNFVYGTAMDFSNPIYRDNFRAIEFAKILGSDKIVIHCCVVPDGPLSGQFGEYNYIYYKSFEEEARRCGMYIGVENLKAGKLHRPDYMDKLLNMLDSPVYYPHVDMGHAMSMGIAPDVFLKKLNCLPVRAMHVHDFNVQTDHMLPFLGQSDWDRIVKAVVDIGYEGDLAMELFRTHELVAKNFQDVLPELYLLEAAIGRELIRRIEEERKARA